MGSFVALALPPEAADSNVLPNGFNFSSLLSAAEEKAERAKWKAALLFHNETGCKDLAYDGFFRTNDLQAVASLVNYSQADYLRMDMEAMPHSMDDYIRDGYKSANFIRRKLVGESDGAASLRFAGEWMKDLVRLAREANPRIVPDLYDVSARFGTGFQTNTWAGLMDDGFAGATPCEYFRMNCLDRLAALTREQRLAIGSSGKSLRPTITPGETPGTFGLPPNIDQPGGAEGAMLNSLLQLFASGATGFALYTSIGMCSASFRCL